MQGGAGNVLNPFHQPHEGVAIRHAHRGKADAAIAHDHGG